MAQASATPSQAAYELRVTNAFLYKLLREEVSPPSIHDTATIRRWITLINQQAGKPELKATQKIMCIIWRRVDKIRYRVKCLRHGRQQAAFLSQEWCLSVTANDVKSPRDTETEQRLAQVLKENASLKQSANTLKKKVASLSDEVRKSKSVGYTPSRGRARNKLPSDCTERHRRNLKRKRKQKCADSLAWLELEGFTASKVEIINKKTGETEVLKLIDCNPNDFLGPGETEVSDESLDALNMALFIKDYYNVSGQAYHEMAQLFKEMPRHYKIKERIAELNRLWDIKPTPAGSCGVQQSLESRLRPCIQQLIKTSPHDADFLKNKKVRVKLTGDGTNIGKRLHVVNFGFTLLDEGEKAYSAEGNHCIAIIKEPESYESLKTSLGDIIKEVDNLKTISVDGVVFEIEYYLGGDWKFLALATGIDSAASNYACIWCKCPALERHCTSIKWSISDPKVGARTIEETIRIAQSRKKTYNVSRPPLFPMIPLFRVVVDNLHMFLRVADVLVDLLITELRRRDLIDKVTKLQSIDRSKLTHLAAFEKTLKEIGISSYTFWVGKESKKLKWRTLTGPEKLRVFSNFKISDILGQSQEVAAIQSLWDELLEVNRCLSSRSITDEGIKAFETKAKSFVDHFVLIYPAKHVTPYMHCMMHHVSEFMTLHGSLLQFTQQGLEKYNDVMTKDYFRSTCHRGQDCLVQILQKNNRLEHLKATGAKREKRQAVTCSNCQLQGHNRWTCSRPCKHCGHTPFSVHLVKIGMRKVPQCQLENQ